METKGKVRLRRRRFAGSHCPEVLKLNMRTLAWLILILSVGFWSAALASDTITYRQAPSAGNDLM